jgi:tetraacyldisaccharide 4'-kinase
MTQLESDSPQGGWKALFLLLYLISLIYLVAVKIRIILFQSGVLKPRRLPRRVVSVGNITAGGTGKTPMVLALARVFQRENLRVAILSRGYKRKSSSRITLVSDGKEILSSVAEAGEEAYFLAKELKGVIVAVGKNRYRTGQYLLRKFDIDLFILDDGFQHLNLHRDSNILLLDAEKPFGNGFLLPRGLLREPTDGIKRATLSLLTRKGLFEDTSESYSTLSNFGMIPTYLVSFVPDGFRDVATSEHFSIESLEGRSALLVSGIGNPTAFRNLAEACKIKVVRELVFPDHHLYQPDDIDAIYDIARSRNVELVITTDKDAVKLTSCKRSDIPMLVLKLKMKTGSDFPWKDLIEGKV